MDKGSWVLDSILSVIPFAGFIGKSLQNINKLNKIAIALQKLKKLEGVALAGKEIINNSVQIVDMYEKANKSSAQATTQQEFIAASRAMQFTADRAGLLMCGSIQSAIRGIFLLSPQYCNKLEEVAVKGLQAFLLEKDNDGNNVHLAMAIRIANLYSFYISDEYEKLRKHLLEQKK